MPGIKAPGGLVTKGNALGFETIRPAGGANLSQFSSSLNNFLPAVMQGVAGNASGGNNIPPGLSGMLNSPFFQCEYGSHALLMILLHLCSHSTAVILPYHNHFNNLRNAQFALHFVPWFSFSSISHGTYYLFYS